MKFKTTYKYIDRETKSKYVYLKYKEILTENILDVGADACHLKDHLDKTVKYTGIGLGPHVDQIVDLNQGSIPFMENSFHCVLCLDVLEHLENIHDIFDQLCRVTQKYLIVSLPNPYNAFWNYLKGDGAEQGIYLKFYGLPAQKPEDRHRWFFSADDAQTFIKSKAQENNMHIVQLDYQGEILPPASLWERFLFKAISTKYKNLNLANKNLFYGTLWVVLEKNRSR